MMRRIIILLIILFFFILFFLLPQACPAEEENFRSFFSSVGILLADGKKCTVFSIGSPIQKGADWEIIVVTAGHCIGPAVDTVFTGEKFPRLSLRFPYAGNVEIKRVQIRGYSSGLDLDIAVLSVLSSERIPGLDISPYIPEKGEEVYVLTLDERLKNPVVKFYDRVVVSGKFIGIETDFGSGDLVVDGVVDSGYSGSPLLNKQGNVIGIVVRRKVKDPLRCQIYGDCVSLSPFYSVPIKRIFPLYRNPLELPWERGE